MLPGRGLEGGVAGGEDRGRSGELRERSEGGEGGLRGLYTGIRDDWGGLLGNPGLHLTPPNLGR